ncbi:hypothetical protein ACOI1C_19040 [Bacillus sp. DJP31]|uniref:hypothetical protein n=1 Tax=Bacillus sp. DJP31 TaxID=3409789 RepID=UPI003BB71AE6
MNLKNPASRRWTILSITCFVIGIIVWIPNLVFNQSESFWLLTFIVNPLGIFFGYLAKSHFGIISNSVMTASFFLLMFFGYLISALFGLKP